MDKITQQRIEDKIIESNMGKWFITHNESHLTENQEVICKICGKTAKEIAKETYHNILKEVNESF